MSNKISQFNLTTEHSLAIDYIKCIGIIFVLYGHYPNGNVWNIMSPYMFHMPLFFFLGGYLFNAKKKAYDFFLNIFNKYFLYIIMSYLILAGFAYGLEKLGFIHKMILFKDGFSETILYILSRNFHNNYFFLVGWFLFAYMLVLCAIYPLLRILSLYITSEKFTNVSLFFLAILFGWIGIVIISPLYAEKKDFIYNLTTQFLVSSMFFLIGFSAKKYIFSLVNPTIASLLFLALVFLKQEGLIGSIYMSWSTYKFKFIYTLFSTFSCIYIIFTIGYLLAKGGVYKVLLLIGRNSKSIMVFHLLFFILMSIFFDYIGVFNMNINNLNQYPNVAYAFPICLLFSIFGSIILGWIMKNLTKGIYS